MSIFRVSGQGWLVYFVHIENIVYFLYAHIVLIQEAAYPQEFQHGEENSCSKQQEHQYYGNECSIRITLFE